MKNEPAKFQPYRARTMRRDLLIAGRLDENAQTTICIVCDNIDGPNETRHVRRTRELAGVVVVKTPAADETMACSSSFSARLDIVRGLRSVLLVPIEDY